MSHRKLVPSIAALLAALLATSLARAQSAGEDPLGRVEVIGTPARTDVRASCPSADANLQEALAYPAAMEGATGIVRVDFTMQGNRVTEVRPSGGPRVYHRAIRRAVRTLPCNDQGAQEQHYSFQIQFMAPGEVPEGQPQMALVGTPR